MSAIVASAASKPMSSGRGPPDWARRARPARARPARPRRARPPTAVPARRALLASGSGSVSVANNTAASRSELSTSVVLCEYSGSLSVLVASPATVGADLTPISTNRSMPRPPAASSMKSRSCVSIQRTGLANCQASSSMTTLRHSSRRLLVTPGVVVGEDLVERLGGHQIADLLDEVAVQRERPAAPGSGCSGRRSARDPCRAA